MVEVVKPRISRQICPEVFKKILFKIIGDMKSFKAMIPISVTWNVND